MTLLQRKRVGVQVILLAAICGSPAHADAGWFEPGDTLLRADLQVLNDADVILLPLNQWPIPRAAVQYALENAKEHFASNSAVLAALERVRARAAVQRAGTRSINTLVNAGSPGLWRDFDTVGREEAEVGVGARYDSDDFSGALNIVAVADPADGQELRADGSHATMQWGNWLLSANTLDRWWGPGHEGSLILSNNARPMPTLMVERAAAKPFESGWLNWLGPWRFSFGISQMEHEREDIDAPLFMAWRVAFMPFRKIELGFSRTAQFCGKQLPCSPSSVWDMLIGHDNPGFNTTTEKEPGNQMAGFDLRWNSPIGNLPYAIYSQMIGEDVSSYVPAKYLSQFGLETWKPMADGGLVQSFFEYSTTTASANTSRGPYYNTAYNQGAFDVEGYRYRGRVIGYTSDRDAENYALGGSYTSANATLWTATARRSRLNRDGDDDVNNTVSHVAADYFALEFGWRGSLFGERLSVDLGAQAVEPKGGQRDIDVFGFIGWRHEFGP